MNVVHNRPNGFALSRDLKPSLVALSDCQPLGREARRHPPGQVRKLARSLDQFGFVYPILIDEQTRVVAGRGLVLAARQLGLTEVPAVRLADLPESSLRALRLALNRITDEAVWDGEALKLEFAEILELDAGIDLQETGFEMGEIDSFLDDFGLGQEDELPESTVNTLPVCVPGDLWVLGEHRLLCGDARSADSYDLLLGRDRARMLFTDPPYNVAADRISGLGAVKHANFVMASGELSSEQFCTFLPDLAGSCGAILREWGGAFRVHGLAARNRIGGFCERDLQRTAKPLRLEEKQRRHGLALSLPTRVRVRLQGRQRSAHQQRRPRPIWAASDKCLGLREPKRAERDDKKQACAAPDGQTGRHDRRCDPRLLQPQRRHP
jgi:hypothetical protein